MVLSDDDYLVIVDSLLGCVNNEEEGQRAVCKVAGGSFDPDGNEQFAMSCGVLIPAYPYRYCPNCGGRVSWQ